MPAGTVVLTLLFTDLEGSTRLWEQQPEAMRAAVAAHDAICQEAVAAHRGRVVKMVGDGLYAVFEDPLDGVQAMLALQHALANPQRTAGLALRARCGLHVGAVEARGEDFFGPPVNRAARIMGVAHGGQMLVSETARELVGDRWPEGVAVLDLGSVRLRDLAAPQRLFQLVAPGLPAQFPALRSLEATPTNLPQQLTSFVGRDEEVQALRARLAHTRLVTLTGAGGIGKTRLALQAGAEALDLFADGVWLVELATLATPDLVVPTVAGALGVREQPGRTALQALQAYLDQRHTLLILDNCEHMLEGVAMLVEQLLGATTGLHVLATSREALRAAGEQVVPLEPLATPGAPATGAGASGGTGRGNQAEPAALEALAALPAVRMFLDRAQAARPGFALDEDNAEDVAEVCRSLDGLPLALELAAARLGTMSAAQLRARLDDRFRLLRGGRRLAQPRQQTLQALIDWSHDLLNPEEQVLMRRLGVFAGSFPAESAQAVAAFGELEGADVEEMLATLAAKSLVVARPDEGRFLMLETLRAYARQRMEAAGEMEGVRERHMGLMLERLERHSLEMRSMGEAQALRQLDTDRADVLEGLAWALQAPGHGPQALSFVKWLNIYLLQRGQVAFGLQQAQRALQLPDGQEESPTRTFALVVAGQYSTVLGRQQEARQHLEQALLLARRLDLPRYEAIAINTLGFVMYELGERAGALRCAREAVDLARRIGDEQQVINALANLGMHLRGAHELIQAQVALNEALQRARLTGRRSPLAAVLLNLAMITLDRGDSASTLSTLDELLPLIDSLRSPTLTACLLDVVAATQESGGDSRSAAALWDCADTLYKDCGATREGPDADFVHQWRSSSVRDDSDAFGIKGGLNLAANEALESALALIRSSLRALQGRPTDPGSHTPSRA
jgi:predicted ATPase/class 3 adenylate cyclase